jgi:hypothetical protein
VSGNFTDLITEFNSQYFDIALQLNQLKNGSNDPIIQGILNLCSYILDNLSQGILQYDKLNTMNVTLQASLEKNKILNSIDSIKKYLESLMRSNYLFSADITAASAKIKKEYVIYIQMYGIPEGGVFDTIKLGEIINNM